jgi:ABC-2 type transport system ATP-binding protein
VHLTDDGKTEGVASYTVATDPGADPREELARALVDGGHGLLELRMAGVSLEDVFLRLTTEESEDEEAGVAA